ncbi:RNA-binding protein 40-like isoform X3 [Diaphorina citri]|uniref:RNA-binding region-containing protein 3 n=1 Tax=Diaphorina citri TaxID=121845 RepID=A0A3Q0J1E7_DIACI|nr:RNA-binding protein 40-like isoform X3 [Diaphorina citri]
MKYKYPHPTLHVLLNIISALCEHKRFCTQVLHLMNKMNLPCPFNREYKRLDKINQLFLHQKSWSETQLYQDLDEIEISTDLGTKNTEHPPDRPDLDQVPMQVDQSDTEDEVESEIDISDTESDRPENRPDNVAAILNLKRALERRGVARIKRPKFIKPMQAGGQSRRSDASKQDEVFDTATSTPASQRKKHIAVHVSADLSSITTHSDTPVEEIHSFGGITNQSDQPIEEIHGFNSITTQSDQPIRSIEANKSPENPSERSTEGDKEGLINLLGGSIEANKDGLRQGRVSSDIPSQAEVKEGEDSQEVKRVITKEQLDSNRLGERDRSFVKAFNNYEPGSPSCRLYVKNLAKQVTLPDLEFIYRRYYLPDYKEQGTMFDIRLMQEGRMKGQAFITLQTVDQAKLALQETNGYILKDKPMVVQYARSIQAKPAP